MTMPSSVAWDQAKAARNVDKHGVAFDIALQVFADPRLTIEPTIRNTDGEDRFKAIGTIQNALYTVVYVMRGDTHRLISARRANSKEARIYARS